MARISVTAFPFATGHLLQASGHELLVHQGPRKITPDECRELVQDAEAIIAGTESLGADVLRFAPHLRVIARLGVGLDSVDLDYCHHHGIAILTTPDAATQTVAEFTLGLILALTRGTFQASQALQQGSWSRSFGLELSQSHLGLVGCGRIGQAVARLAQAFGVQVSAWDPFQNPDVLHAQGIQVLDLTPLLKQSQIVSLHLPLTLETRGLLTAERLRYLQAGAYLVNTSRGGLMDESALLELLQSGHLAGAALDVFAQEPYEGPLCKAPRVILTPHMAASTQAARSRMECQAIQQLISFFRS